MNAAVKDRLGLVRSALYLPASNARAVVKAQGLDCDLAILDLEDAVRDEDKESARGAAIATLNETWKADLRAIRVNGSNSGFHAADVEAALSAKPDLVVVPKVEAGADAARIASATNVPILAMIETPAGVYAAREIASAEGVAGIIVGTNDLAAELRLPPQAGREGMMFALQSILLAVRASGGVAFDGVYNRLDDPEGFEAQCREGRAIGFDGKTLIHPSQVEPCNRLFGPGEDEIEDALALVEAASGGAERFRGRMIEGMHVATARELLARARR
jgi:citrate lyase subunit beta/citryl-CoA lyase